MSGKKVSIGVKPLRSSTIASADEWVGTRSGTPSNGQEMGQEEVKMKRLTLDVPLNLHTAIKSSCASRGVKMADELRELLAERYLKEK